MVARESNWLEVSKSKLEIFQLKQHGMTFSEMNNLHKTIKCTEEIWQIFKKDIKTHRLVRSFLR